jgi:hypothetical protein
VEPGFLPVLSAASAQAGVKSDAPEANKKIIIAMSELILLARIRDERTLARGSKA